MRLKINDKTYTYMGPVSLIATLGTFATSMGGSQLINGYFSRKQQERMALRNREHSEWMEERRQRFQESLAARNFAESERLQWELTEHKHKQALELQESNIQKNWELQQNRMYLETSWPLIAPPLHYLHLLSAHAVNGRLPLQVILATEPEEMKSVSGRVTQTLNNIYSGNIFCYAGGWKPKFRVDTAQMFPLQNDLAGCPTLVLSPQIVADRLELNAFYWGIGAKGTSTIAHSTIYSENLDSFKLDALRAHADRLSLLYADLACESQVAQKLIELRSQEKERYKVLQKAAMENPLLSPDEIIGQEYNKKYRLFFQDEDIKKKVERQIESQTELVMKVVGAVLTDVHYLIEHNEQPKALLLIESLSVEERTKLLPAMAEMYKKLLSELPGSSPLETSDAKSANAETSLDIMHPWKPLYYSLVASAFDGVSGGREYAKAFAEIGWKSLDELYANDETMLINAEFHKDAFKKLACIVENPSQLTIEESEVPVSNSHFKRGGLIVVPYSEKKHIL